MTYTKSRERDEFVALMSEEFAAVPHGVRVELCRKLMSMARTHARLQEAQCNGDYPADNGQRETAVCPLCECCWAPESIRKAGCPSCRIEARITLLCKSHGIEPDFHGDPRGCTVKLKVPSGRTNDWGKVGICVPQ